jgi:dTDP-glucose pyrophosphorylase
MKDWKSILVSPETKLIDSMKILEKQATQFLLVVDEKDRILGTITDGDIRRGILKGIQLDQECSWVMNKNFLFAKADETAESMIQKLLSKKVNHLPIVNDDNKLIDIKHIRELDKKNNYLNPVVILAGGLGTRLGELTKSCPKPLLKVGDTPILERIIQNFSSQGFQNIHLAVNYKSEMIEEYFQSGEKWNVQITYLKEDRKLGTAGPLSMLDAGHHGPVLVMNGDLMTKVNFPNLLDFHEQQGGDATICVRQYDVQIPFGVIQFDKSGFLGFEEKPTKYYFVNAGIYAFSTSVLEFLAPNEYLDMNSFIEKLHLQGKKINIYPLHEYWIDIGRIDDLNRARNDHSAKS